jgi:hypothetical protein
MRGLTAKEYAFLLQTVAPDDTIIAEEWEAVAETLRAQGRVEFVVIDDDWLEVRLTPAGLEALRIHRELQAVG